MTQGSPPFAGLSPVSADRQTGRRLGLDPGQLLERHARVGEPPRVRRPAEATSAEIASFTFHVLTFMPATPCPP